MENSQFPLKFRRHLKVPVRTLQFGQRLFFPYFLVNMTVLDPLFQNFRILSIEKIINTGFIAWFLFDWFSRLYLKCLWSDQFSAFGLVWRFWLIKLIIIRLFSRSSFAFFLDNWTFDNNASTILTSSINWSWYNKVKGLSIIHISTGQPSLPDITEEFTLLLEEIY